MVPLYRLNEVCSLRLIARTIPAHIACRILGNETKPCVLDKPCLQTDKRGIFFFYSLVTATLATVFLVGWWALRITRLSRVLSFIGGWIIPPFRWLFIFLLAIKQFFDNLPE